MFVHNGIVKNYYVMLLCALSKAQSSTSSFSFQITENCNVFSLFGVDLRLCWFRKSSEELERRPPSLLFHYSGFCLGGEGMGITFSVCTIFCSVPFPFYCYECCRCIAVMKNRYDSSPVFIIFHFCQLFPARHSLLMTLGATHKLMPFKIDFHQHSWTNS